MRLVSILVLLAQAFFLNVVVPCHTRGSVVLAGTKEAEAQRPACCCGESPAGGQKDHTPTPYERDHCAICFTAAHTLPFVTYTFALDYLRRAEAARVPSPAACIIAAAVRTDHCRGPPVRSV